MKNLIAILSRFYLLSNETPSIRLSFASLNQCSTLTYISKFYLLQI